MAGYDLDYSGSDKLCPYKINIINESKKVWGYQDLEIREESTGHIVKAWRYNYPRNGEDCFSPFMFEGKWYTLICPKYTSSEVICLETGETVAKLADGRWRGTWCPVNYHVPCFYADPDNPHLLKVTNRVSAKVCSDYRLHGFDAVGWDKLKREHVTYLNTAFVAEVYWACDEEWLVYRLDISSIMKTGIIPLPTKESYCFNFDYSAKPELRQWIKMGRPEVNDDSSYAKFNYLTQTSTDGFKSEEEIPWFLDGP
jgi:hypothetical protein